MQWPSGPWCPQVVLDGPELRWAFWVLGRGGLEPAGCRRRAWAPLTGGSFPRLKLLSLLPGLALLAGHFAPSRRLELEVTERSQVCVLLNVEDQSSPPPPSRKVCAHSGYTCTCAPVHTPARPLEDGSRAGPSHTVAWARLCALPPWLCPPAGDGACREPGWPRRLPREPVSTVFWAPSCRR